MGSQQNKQTWPPAPCLCRCALSHSQMDLSCLPAAAWGSEPHREHVTHTHTHMQTAHINADCQSPIERRDTTETNMSAPEAWAAIILSGKLLWCEGKKQQRLLIDSDSLCADWYQMCFRIITLMLWNLWKMKLNDSCSWCSTVAVLSPVNHPSAVFSSFLMEAVFTVTVIDSWKPSGRRPKTPLKGSLKSRNCSMLN